MKYVLLFLLLLLLPMTSGFSTNTTKNSFCEALAHREEVQWKEHLEDKAKKNKYANIGLMFSKFNKYNLDFNKYLKKLSFHESRGSYKAVNKYTGCLGKYQFKPSTLDYMRKKGSLIVSSGELASHKFLNNRALQEASIVAFTYGNLKALERLGYLDLVGQEINGVKITVSGLLAASHLGGIGGLKKFLKFNIDNKDIHETSISKYMKLMS
jgi:hypothetical protein